MNSRPWIASLLLAPTVAVAGPDWDEPMTDAGALPGDAVPVTGIGNQAVSKITGKLDGFGPAGPGGGDFQDMFLIYVEDPFAFSATVDPGATGFDTQLWLFEISERGLLGNDDRFIPPLTILSASRLERFADDGSAAEVIVPGLYYLAISGRDSDPVAMAGLSIFLQATAIEISGPDGPGGSMPIADWTGSGETGRYEILLSGVEFIECPADVNGDGFVTFLDLLEVLSSWGLPCAGCPQDVNDDGAVGFRDLVEVLSNWGRCETIPGP